MALLIEFHSASLVPRRIPAPYLSLAGIIFCPGSCGRAPEYSCNTIGTNLKTSAVQRFGEESEDKLTLTGRRREDRPCEEFRMPAHG